LIFYSLYTILKAHRCKSKRSTGSFAGYREESSANRVKRLRNNRQ